MQLTADDLCYLGERAIAAAKQAGHIIESHSSKSVNVQYKEGAGNLASQVVTEVDLKSEKAIVEVLKPASIQFDLAVLTEESADDKARLEKDYFWCIDPMDGTLSFVEGIAGYSVAIALVSQTGYPVIGVVYDPVAHILYSAVKGHGVFRNAERWSAPVDATGDSSTGRSLTLVCDRGVRGRPDYSRLHESLVSIVKKHGYAGLEVLERNGAVLNACWVLENPPALYFKTPKPGKGGGSLWDFAASAALFLELGYVATDFCGKPLDLNRKDSTYMNHRGVLFTTDSSLAKDIQKL